MTSLYVGLAGGLARAGDTAIDKALADWESRYKRASCVRYQAVGQSLVPKGSRPDRFGKPMLPESPKRDVVGKLSLMILLDFPGKRYRLDIEQEHYDESTDRLYPSARTSTFDGTILRTYRPRSRNTHPKGGLGPNDPEYATGSGDLNRFTMPMTYWPVFVAHGSVPSLMQGISAEHLAVRPDPDLLYVHGQGVHRGRPCAVIRSHARRAAVTSFDEYWVDTERESAIIRQCCYVGNIPCTDIDIDYQQTSKGWYPKRWTFTQRSPISAKVEYAEDYSIASLELATLMSEEELKIEPKPGMITQDITYPAPKAGESRFTIPGEKTTYEIDANGLRHEIIVDAEGGVHRRVSRWWWGALVLVPIGGGSCYYWWRRRAHRLLRAAPTTPAEVLQHQPDS